MNAPALIRTGVRLGFVALLATSWWLDHGRLTEGRAVADADALATWGLAYTEVSGAAGIDFHHHQPKLDPKIANVEPHVAAVGASVSVTDANGDGWPDLYFTNSDFGQPNALYLNDANPRPDGPGSFTDVAAAAGVADLNVRGEGVSMASIWADVDNDGDEDLFVVQWGHSRLLRNERVPHGELRFTDVTGPAGLRRWMNSNGATWIDYDRDGLVDLYVAGYFSERLDLWNLDTTEIMHDSFEFSSNAGHNVLWHNLGPGPDGLPRFEDVTAATGTDSTRWTLAVTAADFNADGWTDLYLANDYGPEELLLNRDGTRFEAARVGLGEDSKSGMSVAVGDVLNDGRLGVYVTNISKAGFLFQGNNLRLNLLDSQDRFDNVATGLVADCGWAWGAQFGDLDNDGRQDLFVVNGFISADRDKDYWYDMSKVAGASGGLFEDTRNWAPIGDMSLSGYEPSRVLLNRDGMRFTDVAAAVGVTDDLDGRAVALADLWNRGVLDAVVANQRGQALVYRAQVDPARDWLGVELRGTHGNTSAIGAVATLRWSNGGAPREQAQAVTGGSGFASQNDRRLHFGLGPGAEIERLSVRWPSGAVSVVGAPDVRRRLVVEEPR